MKKTLAIAVLVMITWNCYAQPGKIYFMRHGHAGGGFYPIRVFIDEKQVCNVNKNSFSVHEVPPGAHKVAAQFFGYKEFKNRTEELVIMAETGKATYIEMVLTSNGLGLSCMEVTENTATNTLKDMKPDKNCF